MPTYRVAYLDSDTRRSPKTDRYCVRCQKDIKPGAATRMVHVVDGGVNILHPEDENIYLKVGNQRGDCGMHLVGLDCARQLGMEFTWKE
jgi:hypothetical protein